MCSHTHQHRNRIIALEETYYNDSCISSMPEKVRKLDEPHMSTSERVALSQNLTDAFMKSRNQTYRQQSLFTSSRIAVQSFYPSMSFLLSHSDSLTYSISPSGRLQLLYTGTRHMLRYSTIREVLRAGDVELI
jgi:hypothetical protein